MTAKRIDEEEEVEGVEKMEIGENEGEKKERECDKAGRLEKGRREGGRVREGVR